MSYSSSSYVVALVFEIAFPGKRVAGAMRQSFVTSNMFFFIVFLIIVTYGYYFLIHSSFFMFCYLFVFFPLANCSSHSDAPGVAYVVVCHFTPSLPLQQQKYSM